MKEYNLKITIKDKVIGMIETANTQLFTSDMRLILSVLEEIKIKMLTTIIQNETPVNQKGKETKKND